MTGVLGDVRRGIGHRLFERVAGPDGSRRRDRIPAPTGHAGSRRGSPIQQVHGDASMFVGRVGPCCCSPCIRWRWPA